MAVQGLFPWLFPGHAITGPCSYLGKRLSSFGLLGKEAYFGLQSGAQEGGLVLPSRLSVLLPGETPGIVTLKSDLLIPKNKKWLQNLTLSEQCDTYTVTVAREPSDDDADEFFSSSSGTSRRGESPQYCFTKLPYYSLLLYADTSCPSDNHFISCVPAEPRLVQGRGRRELS